MHRLIKINRLGTTIKGYLSYEGCDQYKLTMDSQFEPSLYLYLEALDFDGNHLGAIEVVSLAEKSLEELMVVEQLILNSKGQAIYNRYKNFQPLLSDMVCGRECRELITKLSVCRTISLKDKEKLEAVLKRSSAEYRAFRSEMIEQIFLVGKRRINPKLFDQFIAIMDSRTG